MYWLKVMFVADPEFERLLPVTWTIQLSLVTPSDAS
jgi:hypothetical protein